ncbi:MAG: hypothetical protein ACRBDL_06830 [Alphaproteobacteria bacterium]
MDKDYSNVICLVEFSSNSTHVRASDVQTGAEIIAPETVHSKLGMLDPDTNDLNPVGVHKSLRLLNKHQDIISSIPQGNVMVIGTGALRDAGNTDEFTDRVYDKIGHQTQVLTGAQEARFSALGVMHAFGSDAQGVIWDMGGRSSEFAILQDGEISSKISLPLGSLAIVEQEVNGHDIGEYIQEQLEKLPGAYEKKAFDNLYVIGGTPRRMLGTHRKMAGVDPVGAGVHGYQLSGSDALENAKILQNTSSESLDEDLFLEDGTTHLYSVAPLFTQLLEKIDVQNVIASQHGTRAGALYELEHNVLNSDVEMKVAPNHGNDSDHSYD